MILATLNGSSSFGHSMPPATRIRSITTLSSPAQKNSSPSFTRLKIAQLTKRANCKMMPVYSVLIGKPKNLIYKEHGGHLQATKPLKLFSFPVPHSPQSSKIRASSLIAFGTRRKWKTTSVASSTCLCTTTRLSSSQSFMIISVFHTNQSSNRAGLLQASLSGRKALSRNSRFPTRCIYYS